jgi:hypothetical protein
MICRFIPARSLSAQVQSFFAIDAPDSFVIVMPAFTPQQNVNARHAVTNASGGGDFFNPLSDGSIIPSVCFVIDQRASQQTQSTGSFDRDAIFVNQPFDQLPALFGS